MKPFGKLAVRLAVTVCAAVCAAAAGAFGTSAFDEKSNFISSYEHQPGDGCINVAFRGNFKSTVKEAVDRVNEFRLEACTQGVPDPRDPSRKLTKKDYVPIKWSYDMEQVARLRAAEATYYFDHLRPNGTMCFTADVGLLETGWSEVIAWTTNMVSGLDMFYAEKSDWVKQTSGAVTGHYTSMINPGYTYFGLGCFTDTKGWPAAVCGRFSGSAGTSEKQSPAVNDCYVPVEVQKKELLSVELTLIKGSKNLSKGETAQFEMNGYIGEVGYNEKQVLLYDASWKSSNTAVATVDKYGRVTAKGVGSAKITASCGGKSKSETVNVLPSIADCTVTIPYSSYTYRGRGIKPTVTVKSGSTMLTKGTDYTVSYSNNINVGTATITVTGKGKYSGKTTKTFTVKPLDVSSSYAKLSIPYASYTFTGKAITPAVKFTFKDGSVIPAADYKVTYSSNIKVGKAKITLTALSANIRGSWTKTFVVKPAKQTITGITTSKGLFRIYWNKDLQASGYQVLYCKDKNFEKDVHSWTTFDLDNTVEGFSRVPQSGETWYVKVRSFTAQNNTRYGNYSAVKSITVK